MKVPVKAHVRATSMVQCSYYSDADLFRVDPWILSVDLKRSSPVDFGSVLRDTVL